MPLYFAYGSCMHFRDFARSGVSFDYLGTATLKHYRLAFSKYSRGRRGGVADIVATPGDYVEGILYHVEGFRELDAREGAPYVYRRVKVKVWPHNDKNRWIWVWTYEIVRKAPYEYTPSGKYASLLQEGAQHLSPAYQYKLQKKLNKLKREPDYFGQELYESYC